MSQKTLPSPLSVQQYLDAIVDPERRQDCDTLVTLMEDICQSPAKMWGSSIIGFDTYHYRYASGHEGDACVTGFSSRKSDISIYLTAESPQQAELLSQLGKHKMGKACLRIRRLKDIDMKILSELIRLSVAEIKQRYQVNEN